MKILVPEKHEVTGFGQSVSLIHCIRNGLRFSQQFSHRRRKRLVSHSHCLEPLCHRLPPRWSADLPCGMNGTEFRVL